MLGAVFGGGCGFGGSVVIFFFLLILPCWVVVDVGEAVGCCRHRGREVV